MTISDKKIYPRTNDTQTVYLKNVINDTNIEVGDYTMYQSRQIDYRKILFYCMWCKIYFYKRKSLVEFIIYVSISVVL